jgi:membrane protein implicated in regulation of membrane protease activity
LSQKKNATKPLLAVIGLVALAAIAAWQFYLFTAFKDAQGVVDVQGGTIHLWLAIGIALIVCIAGIFLFSRLLRHDDQDDIHITSPGQALAGGRTTEEVL